MKDSGDIGAAILVGGASRRMGADKSAVRLDGQTLLSRVVGRLSPQVDDLILVGDLAVELSGRREIVVPDSLPGRLGPLAGILSALEWFAYNRGDIRRVFVSSVDMPFLPLNVVDRLQSESSRDRIVFAVSGAQIQYLASLWPIAMALEIRAFFERGAKPSIKNFVKGIDHDLVSFASEGIDPFINLNTPEDLERAVGFLTKKRAASKQQ